MTQDRALGVTLYALAVLLLAAGASWFFTAVPRIGEDPALTDGRRALERLIPELPLQADAETLVIGPGSMADRSSAVRGGAYALVVACAGEGRLRLRLSTTTTDPGRVIPCAARPAPVELTVTPAGMFFLTVNSESEREVAFRWRLTRATTF
ncbi:DUF6023 family protein [Actinoplanes sp. NPDC051494]|uniref:DUF6023 family protein n=1 Tax=Actinoplanes sp. NPDC051494 TaxID=3363907 RepID=UPI0037BCFBC7